MSKDFDICIVGSGAGGGPIAYELALAGYDVLVLEKGKWLQEEDFYKDEMACCIHEAYTPNLKEEQHVVETEKGDGWRVQKTSESGRRLQQFHEWIFPSPETRRFQIEIHLRPHRGCTNGRLAHQLR